ncbi:unnamed protein product [Brassica oleracea var. botrytis]|uniref:(rape) hypothetical protein n=1 Tax=Brassica napus TaxID=3708 RepID=A0A816J0L3_BRANA|nr:unnamed protein product [Brassica napus]
MNPVSKRESFAISLSLGLAMPLRFKPSRVVGLVDLHNLL